MEQNYLIDTNILIYYLDGRIPESAYEKVSKIIECSLNISTITKIELLGWQNITAEIRQKIANFIKPARILYISSEVEELTIQLKQSQKIPLPDAVIAATAIFHNLTLVTRNTADFKNIVNLKTYNPFVDI